IITLPDGRRFGIVIYVTDFIGAHTKGELVIAKISKLAFDYYSKN
ncbi:MAG: class A beta-lactamase, partial [Bacteroidia bacterium]|nr:class A beta-lactamase [Bacteroidia bacterium]